jgi:hypothetical protein
MPDPVPVGPPLLADVQVKGEEGDAVIMYDFPPFTTIAEL